MLQRSLSTVALDSPWRAVAGSFSLMSRSRLTLICAPLIAFALVCALPYGAARLSLVLHGHPFARIVPKDRLNIFDFVPVDNFCAQAVVFSHENAIGYIDDEMSSFPQFMPLLCDAELQRFSTI